MGCGCSQSQVVPLAPSEFLPVVPGAGGLDRAEERGDEKDRAGERGDEKDGAGERGDEDVKTPSEQRKLDDFNTQQRVEAPRNLVAFRSMSCDPSPAEVTHPFPSCLPLHKAKINRLNRHLIRWRKAPSTFVENVTVKRDLCDARRKQQEEDFAQQP
eukprot:gb/GFBE01026602.1/.p1 GENE.gb/GFBE01026602.1/~~gb/GFBE01026602.1/.p1  ORF type:complete len:157 (+),score=25.79 gb/GFBE01026602.1/:1-471(+)